MPRLETDTTSTETWSSPSRVKLREAGAALGRMLLSPVAEQLDGRRLVVVADGALQYVPFSALPSPRTADASDYLVKTNEVVTLPSASVLAQLRRAGASRRPAPKALAVIADPVFSEADPRVRAARARNGSREQKTREGAGVKETAAAERDLTRSAAESISAGGGIPRLPFTRREAESIYSLVPAGEGFKAVDFTASRAEVTGGGLSQYRVVHFATHGLLNSRHPELSGVVLSLVDEGGGPPTASCA